MENVEDSRREGKDVFEMDRSVELIILNGVLNNWTHAGMVGILNAF